MGQEEPAWVLGPGQARPRGASLESGEVCSLVRSFIHSFISLADPLSTPGLPRLKTHAPCKAGEEKPRVENPGPFSSPALGQLNLEGKSMAIRKEHRQGQDGVSGPLELCQLGGWSQHLGREGETWVGPPFPTLGLCPGCSLLGLPLSFMPCSLASPVSPFLSHPHQYPPSPGYPEPQVLPGFEQSTTWTGFCPA